MSLHSKINFRRKQNGFYGKKMGCHLSHFCACYTETRNSQRQNIWDTLYLVFSSLYKVEETILKPRIFSILQNIFYFPFINEYFLILEINK